MSAKAFKQVPIWPDEVWFEGERETLRFIPHWPPYQSVIWRSYPHYSSGRLVDMQPGRRDQVVHACRFSLVCAHDDQ